MRTSSVRQRNLLNHPFRSTANSEVFDRMKSAIMDELRKSFRPEFLNRVDELIVFHALSEQHLNQIIEVQLQGVRARLAPRRITLEMTDAAKAHLVKVGYDPSYGARPLKRVLQKEVETGLAQRIIKGEVRDGMAVTVDYDPTGEVLVFGTALAVS